MSAFVVNMPGQPETDGFYHYPSGQHNCGGLISFVDGHAATHKWKDLRTLVPIPGQDVSGDLYVVTPFVNGLLMAVVDGLGHGIEATNAARAAVSVFNEHPSESIVEMINRCHEALLNTRGAVMTVGSFNFFDNTLTWLGVGNVEGRLLYADLLAAPRFQSVQI